MCQLDRAEAMLLKAVHQLALEHLRPNLTPGQNKHGIGGTDALRALNFPFPVTVAMAPPFVGDCSFDVVAAAD